MTTDELSFDSWIRDQVGSRWREAKASGIATSPAEATRPTCDTCQAVYTPTGPYWDGTAVDIEAMARAAGWGMAVGLTNGGTPYAVVACPRCRRGVAA